MSNKVLDKKFYRYKIIDDVANLGDGTNINRIHLDKSKWKISENNIHELERYIRTPSNLKGVVQIQEFNPSSNVIYYDSLKYVTGKKDLIVYTRDQLGLMDREELIEVCRYYGIDPIHRPDKFLVKYIIDKQREELEYKNNTETSLDKEIEDSFSSEPSDETKTEKVSSKKKK